MFVGVATAALHSRLQQLLQVAQGFFQSVSHCLCVGLFAAVEGGDGEVDVVRLGVVAHGVTVGNERPETHHAVCVSGNLQAQKKRDDEDEGRFFMLRSVRQLKLV